MYQTMVLLVVAQVLLYASLSDVYEFELCDSFYCRSHPNRHDSFVPTNWTRYLIPNILKKNEEANTMKSNGYFKNLCIYCGTNFFILKTNTKTNFGRRKAKQDKKIYQKNVGIWSISTQIIRNGKIRYTNGKCKSMENQNRNNRKTTISNWNQNAAQHNNKYKANNTTFPSPYVKYNTKTEFWDG